MKNGKEKVGLQVRKEAEGEAEMAKLMGEIAAEESRATEAAASKAMEEPSCSEQPAETAKRKPETEKRFIGPIIPETLLKRPKTSE